jgi:hypothetical protein
MTVLLRDVRAGMIEEAQLEAPLLSSFLDLNLSMQHLRWRLRWRLLTPSHPIFLADQPYTWTFKALRPWPLLSWSMAAAARPEADLSFACHFVGFREA